MKTIYHHVKEKDFNRKNYPDLTDFPNKYVKEYIENGEKHTIYIIPKKSKIVVRNVSKKEMQWHGAGNREVVEIRAKGFHSIPTDLIVGVTNGMLDENHPTSTYYGWIQTVNLGTSGEYILKSKIKKCIKRFKQHGYKVVVKNNKVKDEQLTEYDQKVADLFKHE